MAPIPEHELAAVNGMDGYEQLLEIDRLCKVHGVDEATLRAAMASASGGSPSAPTTPDTSASWDTSHKHVPDVHQASPTVPKMVDKRQFRFEYDPSREAAQRRAQVNQAILCSACGVALGIPDVRPIRVTCPACLFETTYTH